MGEGIERSSHFELLTPVRLNIVCFALRGANNDQRDLFLEKLKEDGQVLLTPTFFGGKARYSGGVCQLVDVRAGYSCHS